MKYTYLTLAFLLIITGCKPSQIITKKKNDKEDLINFLFRNYTGEKPSASFVVIKDGEVKKSQSFGYADLENKILANSKTNYRLASVTKQYTAMSILILIQQGKLTYETKLTEVIPEFPDYGKEITIKNLLTHRSGLQSYEKLYPKNSKKQILDKDILTLLKEQDSLIFTANSKFKYSNSGYAILSQIVERVSKKSFKQFMDDEVFQKIGMSNSTVYLKNLEIKNRAFGYKIKDTIFERKDQSLTSAVQGDGGVYSSVNDFYLWDKNLSENTLITPDLKNDAFTSWDENGKTQESGCGFGWFVAFNNKQKYVWHTGSSIGFRSSVLRIPSEKIAVAIYTNSHHYGRELRQGALALASLYSKNKFPMPIDVMIEKEININGSEHIKEYYDKLISDKNKYDINKKNLSMLAYSYFKKKESLNCFNICKLLISQFPSYYGGFFDLAEYYRANGNNKKAIENFKKVIELAPSHARGAINHSKKMIGKLSK